VRGEHLGHVVPVQPSLDHDAAGNAVAGSDLLQPAGFAHRIGRVPFGFDVHRLDDAMTGAVGEIVLGQVVPAQRAVLPVAERDGRLIVEPGMIVAPHIPEMLVRIDDREVIHASYPFPPAYLEARLSGDKLPRRQRAVHVE